MKLAQVIKTCTSAFFFFISLEISGPPSSYISLLPFCYHKLTHITILIQRFNVKLGFFFLEKDFIFGSFFILVFRDVEKINVDDVSGNGSGSRIFFMTFVLF